VVKTKWLGAGKSHYFDEDDEEEYVKVKITRKSDRIWLTIKDEVVMCHTCDTLAEVFD
jgi:hypothetical protein